MHDYRGKTALFDGSRWCDKGCDKSLGKTACVSLRPCYVPATGVLRRVRLASPVAPLVGTQNGNWGPQLNGWGLFFYDENVPATSSGSPVHRVSSLSSLAS